MLTYPIPPTDDPTLFWAMLAIAYLIGSIPFGYILMKASGQGDLRDMGSGNVGATNVLRSGNKKLSALTLLLDVFKGAIAIGIAGTIEPTSIFLAAIGVILGHLFPIWLKFRGGKGVATSLGVALAISFPLGLLAIGVWILVFALCRYVSLAAIMAFSALPYAAVYFSNIPVAALSVFLFFTILLAHSSNIKRLFRDTEPKTSFNG